MATRDEWAERVERWQKSGLSAEVFAGRERLKVERLKWWRWKLRASTAAPSEATQFLPVHIVESRSSAAASASVVAVEIALPNGRVVRVPPGFDATTLTRVLAIAGAEEDASC